MIRNAAICYIYRCVETAKRSVAEVSINFSRYAVEVVNSHYACVDVITAAVLLHYLLENKPFGIEYIKVISTIF